jgi:hypothetical protein
MTDKQDAIYFELLMKLYYSSKPVHCSVFVEEEYFGLGENLIQHLSSLKERGLVENPVIFNIPGKETPLFFKLSDSGKKLVEKIIRTFPLNE